jgi:hypothetical protein
MMRTVRRFLPITALLLSLACVGSSGGEPKEKLVPNELPRSWRFREIAKATPPSGAGGRVFVLAWSIMQDDRPVRAENSLTLRVMDRDDGHGRWCLAHLYRDHTAAKPQWQLAYSHIFGEEGTKYPLGRWVHRSKRFKKKPSNLDIYGSFAVTEVGWRFEPPQGLKFVSCAVCEKSWEAAIGEKPTQFFGH